MEVKYLRGICGDEHGLSNCSKILWLESFIHKSESNTWGFPKCYVAVHVLRLWMTCSVLCDRLCAFPMDDSFTQTAYENHLANWCPWTILMDELETVIFAIPLVAPLSRGRPRILLGFNSRFYGSDLTPFLFFFFFFFFGATCHDLIGWPVASIVFFKGISTCRLFNGWCRFANPTSGPYK